MSGPPEPPVKRTFGFIDGQNLFYAVKKAFGYRYPNYDPKALAERITSGRGWALSDTFFYTGIPDRRDNPFWNHFWTAKLAVMGTRGVQTFSRPIRYRNQTVRLPDRSSTTILIGEEKGVDVRLALDVVRMARENRYDVALIFSQDQDLSEAADEVRAISKEQARWIKVACAFPVSPTAENRRGINGTDWVTIDRATYDACLDRNDYRPKKS
ncbi:MAG: NYN domain-containing protein [Acidobacteria bacterium]|nr:NYN domain-containing protein [Acidobacteriota bacterium]